MNPFPRPCLMLVTEPRADLPQIVAEAVAGGVDIVQWRDKTTPQPELTAQVPAMQAALTGHTLLVVNGRVTLAEEIGHGMHLSESGLSAREVRPALRPNALVGRSVHSVQAALEAAADGADYLIAGTIYPSLSHPDGKAQGLDFLHAICQSVSVPVLAIGGITPERVAECMNAGAAGVAVLSPIMHAQDPCTVAQQYRAALDRS